MAEGKFPPTPTRDQVLAISCTNVGVGPGGTTAMLACVSRFFAGDFSSCISQPRRDC